MFSWIRSIFNRPSRKELLNQIEHLNRMLTDPSYADVSARHQLGRWQLEFSGKHHAVKLLAWSFKDTLDSIGAKNFMTCTLGSDEHGWYEIRLRRAEGLTFSEYLSRNNRAMSALASIVQRTANLMPESIQEEALSAVQNAIDIIHPEVREELDA